MDRQNPKSATEIDWCINITQEIVWKTCVKRKSWTALKVVHRCYSQAGESSVPATFHAGKGSLSNHDDDGNKNVTNLHIWQWKTVFLRVFTCIFPFLTFCRRSRSFYDVKWPVLHVCGRLEHMMTNVQFCLVLCPKRWFQFNSRIVRTQFPSIMSLNNWNTIAETRGHISRWRSRFRRRRVCLSSLN